MLINFYFFFEKNAFNFASYKCVYRNLTKLNALQARPLLTRALEDGNFDTLVDQRLQNDYNNNEMAHMVACAAACVRHSARRRPRMSQVTLLALPLLSLNSTKSNLGIS